MPDCGPETETLISYNRPLTREAERDLAPFTIVRKTATNELGHWTEVVVEELPPDDLLEYHELRRVRTIIEQYKVDGEVCTIYDDGVTYGAAEQTISPEEAREYAQEHGWERVK